jgi:hypothetical protein
LPDLKKAIKIQKNIKRYPVRKKMPNSVTKMLLGSLKLGSKRQLPQKK